MKKASEEFIVKLPGERLSKVLDLKLLDKRTQREIIKAYKDSNIYAPNLTASKSEKLAAAMSSNIYDFRESIKENPDASAIQKVINFCEAFELDSVHTPLTVKLFQAIAAKGYSYVNIDILVDILRIEHGQDVVAADLYFEFQNWKYYQIIKDRVGGVSIVKFTRFFIGLMQH